MRLRQKNGSHILMAAVVLAMMVGCAFQESDSASASASQASEPQAPVHVERTSTPHERWSPPPPETAQRLIDRELDRSGKPPELDTALASFGAGEIAAWRRTRLREGVRVTTPRLPAGLGDTTRVRLRARTAGAHRLRVIPHVASSVPASQQRLERAVEVPLDRSLGADETVTVSVDVADVLRDTWEDVERRGRLLGFEFDFLDPDDPQRVRLEQVTLNNELSSFSGAAAGRQTVSLGDVIRPTLFTHPEARIRVPVTLPEGQPELRWQDGSVGPAGARLVSVLHDGRRTELARITDSAPDRWRAQRASLAPWAGREVTLEFAAAASSEAERSGVGLFGNPEIVAGPLPAETPDVVLYLIDTLRADRLGAYGAETPDISPTFDRLAGEGVLFERLISSSSWTKPAIPTLMTGIWPTTHRVGATANTDRLPAEVPLVQARFAAAGWRTGSFTANPLGSTLSGLERGFDVAYPPRFWQGRVGSLGHPSATQLHEALLSWLDEQPDRPVFAYVHTVEVHEYHRPMYQRSRSGLAPYNAAVQDADRKLGELMAALDERGRDRNLLLVIVSDHGESLGEHDLVGHGMSLYQQELHVPLLFWAHGSLPARRVESIASLADIAPTLLELCGLPSISSIDGRSLADAVSKGVPPGHPFVPAALLRVLWRLGAPREHAVLTAEGTKLIRKEGGTEDAYDLTVDPGELSPLPQTPARAARVLDRWMQTEREEASSFEGAFGPVGSTELDRDAAERLRSLGYIE